MVCFSIDKTSKNWYLPKSFTQPEVLMPRILTHMNVDIDAALSVIALQILSEEQQGHNITFVRADWNGRMGPGDIALDIRAGGRGLKGEEGEDGTIQSCFDLVVRTYGDIHDYRALLPLIEAVNKHDAHGDPFHGELEGTAPERRSQMIETSIIGTFRAIRAYLRGEPKHQRDQRTIELLTPIVYGYLHNGHLLADAWNQIENEDGVVVFGDKVALITKGKNPRLSEALQIMGVRIKVIVDDKNVVVFCKNPTQDIRADHQLFRDIVGNADEKIGDGNGHWFAHPSGFLFAWGTRKAPASHLSRVNPDHLRIAACQLLDVPLD